EEARRENRGTRVRGSPPPPIPRRYLRPGDLLQRPAAPDAGGRDSSTDAERPASRRTAVDRSLDGKRTTQPLPLGGGRPGRRRPLAPGSYSREAARQHGGRGPLR